MAVSLPLGPLHRLFQGALNTREVVRPRRRAVEGRAVGRYPRIKYRLNHFLILLAVTAARFHTLGKLRVLFTQYRQQGRYLALVIDLVQARIDPEIRGLRLAGQYALPGFLLPRQIAAGRLAELEPDVSKKAA